MSKTISKESQYSACPLWITEICSTNSNVRVHMAVPFGENLGLQNSQFFTTISERK